MAKIIVDELVVKVDGQIDGLTRSMQNAENRVSKSMRAMEVSSELAVKSFQALLLVGTAVGGVLSVTGKNILEVGDRIQKLGLKLGVTTEFLSEMNFVAQQSGTSLESIATAVQYMQKNLTDAAQGTGTAIDALKLLGLEINNLTSLSPEKQFEKIGSAIASIDDAAMRTQIAMDIFGRSGTELNQVFAGGAESIKKLREEAAELGLTLSQKQADNIAAINDQFNRMKKIFSGIVQEQFLKVAPEFLKKLQEYSSAENIEKLKSLIVEFENLSLMLYKFAKFAKDASEAFGELAADYANFFSGRSLGLGVESKASKEIDRLQEKMKELEKEGKKIPSYITNPVVVTATRLPQVDRNAPMRFTPKASPVTLTPIVDVAPAQKEFEKLEKTALITFEQIDRAGKVSMESWADQLTDSIFQGQNAFLSLRNIAITVANDIARAFVRTQIVAPLLNGVFGGISGLSGGLFGMGAPISPTPVSVVGQRAFGGSTSAKSPYLVGENGPEIFVPDVSGSVATAKQTQTILNGGTTKNVTVNQYMTFTTDVQSTVRKEIAAAAPIIATNAKNAVFADIEKGNGAARAVGRR